jgi:two-component system chemotaxis response regulator CheY
MTTTNNNVTNENEARQDYLKGVHILVVDDTEDIREMVAFVLTKYGAKVETAMDGAEAVVKAQGAKFDCILMDMRMPGLDGNATARRIKEEQASKHPNTIFIALTGEQSKTTLAGKEFPFDNWIYKPIKPFNLSKCIHDSLKHGLG